MYDIGSIIHNASSPASSCPRKNPSASERSPSLPSLSRPFLSTISLCRRLASSNGQGQKKQDERVRDSGYAITRISKGAFSPQPSPISSAAVAAQRMRHPDNSSLSSGHISPGCVGGFFSLIVPCVFAPRSSMDKYESGTMMTESYSAAIDSEMK